MLEVRNKIYQLSGLVDVDDDKILNLPTDKLKQIFTSLSSISNTILLGGEAFHPSIDGNIFPIHPLLNIQPVPTIIGHCEN